MTKRRVAVIGAGLAGLCTARCLAEASSKIEFVVFEKNPFLGGLWNYDDRDTTEFWLQPTKDSNRTACNGRPLGRPTSLTHNDVGYPTDTLTSCLYNNLRSNLPKDVMCVPGYSYPRSWDSFVTHKQVLEYVQSFAQQFSLESYIRLSHTVELVKLIEDGCKEKWKVSFRSAEMKKSETEIFDAVIICNGHFSEPKYPDIPGLCNFKGIILHSRFYRNPQSFKGLNVVVVGAAASGLDISIDLSSVAKTVVISHRKSKAIASSLPKNVKDYPLISSVADDGKLLFEDGSIFLADAIVFCTGYALCFPFLDASCGIQVEHNTLRTLYKHIFNIQHPSLSFVGLQNKIAPAPHFHIQASSVCAVLAGDAMLPSQDVMAAHTKDEIERKQSLGLEQRFFHYLGNDRWDYLSDLCDEFGPAPICRGVADLDVFIKADRWQNLLTYRNRNYEVIGDSFIELDHQTKPNQNKE